MDLDSPENDTLPLQLGRYRHFKGKEYEVLGCALHSETGETLVIYRALYGKGEWWVRPLTNFVETVMHEGKEIKRFRLLD